MYKKRNLLTGAQKGSQKQKRAPFGVNRVAFPQTRKENETMNYKMSLPLKNSPRLLSQT